MTAPCLHPLGAPNPGRRWFVAALLAAFLFLSLSAARGPQAASMGLGETASSLSTPDSDIPGDNLPAEQHRAQILECLGVKSWHDIGQRGQGVKVAVLDSGFCGYRAHLGKALPQTVLARSFRLDGNLEAHDSQHGILCGEVIHTLAPDAELLFANWEPDRPERFLQAVRWAREQGAKIISCSVIMPTWSDGEGQGTIHRELQKLLGSGNQDGDLLFFASAGNTAQRHWCGRVKPDGNGNHLWQTGEIDNLVTPWNGERLSVELCWQPGPVYAVDVRDLTAEKSVGRKMALLGADRCSAVVRFLPQAGHTYGVRIRQVRGEAGRVHLVVLGGSLQEATLSGSIPFPGDGPEVVAVGAVGGDGQRLLYSSCGDRAPLPKPDLVAPVPFPSMWRTRPFSGTSAAAPQAAALAALVWARQHDGTANLIRNALTAAARRTGGALHSLETGFGRIHLP